MCSIPGANLLFAVRVGLPDLAFVLLLFCVTDHIEMTLFNDFDFPAYNTAWRWNRMVTMADDEDDKPKKLYPNLKPWKTQPPQPPRGSRYAKHADAIAKIGDNVEDAIEVVVGIMKAPRLRLGDELRLRAANSIIDRILGKAPQSVAASFLHRTISADGTVIEGPSGSAMSPLLQAANSHIAQEELCRLVPPPATQDAAQAPAQAVPEPPAEGVHPNVTRLPGSKKI